MAFSAQKKTFFTIFVTFVTLVCPYFFLENDNIPGSATLVGQ